MSKETPSRQDYFCENCGKPVSARARRCPHCGKEFLAVRCPKCAFTGKPELFESGCPVCGYTAPTVSGHTHPVQKTASTAAGKKSMEKKAPAARRGRRPMSDEEIIRLKRSRRGLYWMISVFLVVAIVVLIVLYINM